MAATEYAGQQESDGSGGERIAMNAPYISNWTLAKKLVANSAAYGFFRFINQVGAMLMLPVYWQYLTPADFGVIAIAGIISMFIQPVLNLGLHSSVERFYFEYTKLSRRAVITKLWIISIAAAAVMTVTLDQLLTCYYDKLFSSASYSEIRVIVLTIFFSSLQYIPFVILRVTERVKEFGVITSLGFLSTSAINIALVIGLGMGVEGYFLGQCASAVIWGVYWLVWMRKHWLFSWRTPVGVELRYSIYQLPIVVVDAGNRVVDKFLLEKYLGQAQFGIYSIADKFGGLFYQVNSSLKAAFFPIIYKMFGQGDSEANRMLPRVSMLYGLFLAYAALLFSLLSGSFVHLFATPEFHDVVRYIPFFVLIYFIKSQETIWGRGADIAKRNDIQMYVSVPLLLGSIGLLYFLIPQYGIFGALTGLLFATTLRVGILIYVGHQLYRRKFPTLQLSIVIACCCIIYFIVSLINIDNQWGNLALRFGVTTFTFLILFRVLMNLDNP